MRGVRVRAADSSSGLSPPLFSFLLSACTSQDGRQRPERWTEGEEWARGGVSGVATDGDEEAKRKEETKERGEGEGERKVQGSSEGTYTQSLSADHQINVLVYFPVLVLRLGAVADRVVSIGVWAVAAV